MKIFCVTALIISGVAAGLCLLALPFWLMGVPGAANSYAKGWKLGLYTVIAYPFAWFCIFRFWKSIKAHTAADQLPTVELWTGTGSLLLLVVASGVVRYAFRIMSQK